MHLRGKSPKRKIIVGRTIFNDSQLIILDPEIGPLRGKEVLQALVRNHQEEYLGMQVQEREALIQEFEEQKATVAKSFRLSNKSRINDTTQTLSAIENEVRSQ